MIASGLFTESMAFDVGVIAGLVTILGGIVGLMYQVYQWRKEAKQARIDEQISKAAELKKAVREVLSETPDKVVLSNQPLVIAKEKTFVETEKYDADLKRLENRISALETHRQNDKMELMTMIDGIPERTIAMLSDVWRMKE